jgi:hypothetical protein
MRAAGLNVDEMYVVSPMSDHGLMRLFPRRVVSSTRIGCSNGSDSVGRSW